MEQAETLQGNILIAKFMGFINLHSENWFVLVLDDGTSKEFYADGPICYHSSWDWLMPAVERIEDLGVSIMIKRNLVFMFGWIANNPNTTTLYKWNGGGANNSKRLATWYGVVEFIKWYNKQELPND